MRTERRPPFYLAGLFLLFALFTCCEDKPDFLGRELLPSGDDFFVRLDSLEVVHGYSKNADSVRTGFKEIYLLGNIVDPFFGYSSAEIVSTIAYSPTSKGFGFNAETDSVILFLKWDEIIGEGFAPLDVHLYEFTEFIQYDSAYYSNWDIRGKYREQEIGSARISFGDTIAKIYISDQEFEDKFLNAEDSILRNSNYLQELIKGLYFTTDKAVDEGGIAQINFSDVDNMLRFYYHNDTAIELTQDYSLDLYTNGQFNIFRHDPAGYPLEEYLQSGSQNDSLIFVQSMVGASSIIRFPELTHWMDSMPVAINEARLIFTVADTSFTMQHSKYQPEKILMYLVQEDGSFSRTYDYLLDPDNVGGEFNPSTQSYTFDIKVQIQSIIAGDVGNLGMLLITSNTGEVVSRTGLYGWNELDPGKRIRLEIIYTKL